MEKDAEAFHNSLAPGPHRIYLLMIILKVEAMKHLHILSFFKIKISVERKTTFCRLARIVSAVKHVSSESTRVLVFTQLGFMYPSTFNNRSDGGRQHAEHINLNNIVEIYFVE